MDRCAEDRGWSYDLKQLFVYKLQKAKKKILAFKKAIMNNNRVWIGCMDECAEHKSKLYEDKQLLSEYQGKEEESMQENNCKHQLSELKTQVWICKRKR